MFAWHSNRCLDGPVRMTCGGKLNKRNCSLKKKKICGDAFLFRGVETLPYIRTKAGPWLALTAPFRRVHSMRQARLRCHQFTEIWSGREAGWKTLTIHAPGSLPSVSSREAIFPSTMSFQCRNSSEGFGEGCAAPIATLPLNMTSD